MVKNMMDRNREARRAAAMTNGLPRRRHRTTTGGSLRESPEDESPMELQETAARLRERTVKKDRDREMRDRERDRDRDRLNRSKRRRGDKYLHREDGGGGDGDDSSEDSVNDEDEEDEDGQVRYVQPSNPAGVSSTSAASSLTSHRKSIPPPSKVIRVAPTWKAPDEMIGVSIPRKARSASTKRGHECWNGVGAGVGSSGEQQVNINQQASPSPVRSSTTPTQIPTTTAAAPQGRPMSPSSSNVSIKKKIATNGPKQQRPPKSKSSPSIQDEIEIEVAEVLYGLMRQSHAPSSKLDGGTPNDSTNKLDSRSIHDSKSRVSSPSRNSSSLHNINHSNPSTSSSSTPLTTIAPKRKRPRPYTEENPSNFGHRSSPKVETDQTPKLESPCPGTERKAPNENGGDLVNTHQEEVPPAPAAVVVGDIGMLPDGKKRLEEESSTNGMLRAKVEEASSSPKMESPQNYDRVESSTTSNKPNSTLVEQENHREDKLEIDLMAPPPQLRSSPERGEEIAENVGRDEKCMVAEKEAEEKASTIPKLEEDEKSVKNSESVSGGVELKAPESEPSKRVPPPSTLSQAELNLNGKDRETNIDLHLDLEKTNANDDKLNIQKQLSQPPLKATTKDDANTDIKPGGQSGSGPLPMSVPGGWHGGLQPMGYVGPLQGVVSMDGTPMASPPIQHPTPHFLFTQPRPKRCATHCYVARSISVHQQMMKMNPFWPAAAAAAAAGTAPLFSGKPYNLNMLPSADLHGAGRGVVVNSSQDNKSQPFTFFPGQPAPASSSKDKSPLTTSNASDSAQKKQFLLQPALPPGAPSNLLHGPALFFPMGQQQPAVANARPASSTKSPSTTGAASVSASTSAPMSAVASHAGPAMSFSYPNMGGNEAQFMAILGNGGYPFPIPAHVGAAPPYRGSHPQPMSFFNGSFYSSQMLHHPSQLQQQAAQQQQSQSMQIQQQNQPNASISTASSSSQKQLQNLQQQRPHGNSGNVGLQNFQSNKGRASQPHHEMGGEDSPSTADSRTRPNMGVYGQNFAMPPFHSANFTLMTPPSSMGSNATGVSNGNHGDKKQQQQQPPPQQTPAFPMSYAAINGATTPGLDISSLAQNPAMIQSLPEAARQNYQLMAAAAAAQAQVAQQKKNNNYRGSEDGKTGAVAPTDPSNIDEERKALVARAAAAVSVGQSIAFSRDLSENSMPGNNVVDTSARSLNLIHGSSNRPTRSSAPNTMSNSNASSNSQQQQQQQMLFTKQQQFVGPTSGSGRSKTPTTTNGNAYPDHHLTSSPVMAAKFPNSLSGFPPLVQQTSGAPVQSTQWKSSGRPNTSQGSSPSAATSNVSNIKNLPQQQGRTQQNHTQISFGATAANPKTSSTSQGQQAQNNNQAPSSPMVVGSPSTSSVSKGASGSPRTNANASMGNKAGGQASSLSSQQGKNSQSPSLSNQKPSLLGSPHHIMPSTNSGNKPQMQQSQQQPQLSKQTLQQTQMFFNNAYMQATANASAAVAGGGYYLQRHRPDNQQQQQQQQQQQHQQQQQQHGSKSQGMGHTASSSGMLSLCTPVSLANSNTSDPAKAVAAAAAANSMKGGMPSQGIFHAAQFAAQSAGGTHQLMPAGFPYVHAVSTAVQVKPVEQKQPAGE